MNKYGLDPKDENFPCVKCGRTDLPLLTNHQCPDCCIPGTEGQARDNYSDDQDRDHYEPSQ